jgi:rare lipoprotein A
MEVIKAMHRNHILQSFLYDTIENILISLNINHSTPAFSQNCSSDGKQHPTASFFSTLILLAAAVGILSLSSQPAFARNEDSQAPRTYTINNQVYRPAPEPSAYKETGLASWYGNDFNGHSTYSGETYDMNEQTAAHKLLPMNTILLVSNLENGKKTIVRVNDRGPYVQGRIIDLSYRAAKKLDLVGNGTARVRVTTLTEDRPDSANGSSPGEFYIQIGPLKEKTAPVSLQKKFADIGQTAVIREIISGKSILYRVCIYAGQELQNVNHVEDILHLRGLKEAFEMVR